MIQNYLSTRCLKTLYFTAFMATVEKSYHTYLENMNLSQLKMEEHQAKCRVLAVLLGGVCCYGATCTFGSKRVDTLCWRNAAWCQSHVAPTGENHLGRNQNPEQIAWNENHLFHETGLVRNLWGSTDYNWSKFKTCVMIHRPFKLFKMVFEVIQSKSRWPYNLST